jgi:hypothetical protein
MTAVTVAAYDSREYVRRKFITRDALYTRGCCGIFEVVVVQRESGSLRFTPRSMKVLAGYVPRRRRAPARLCL